MINTGSVIGVGVNLFGPGLQEILFHLLVGEVAMVLQSINLICSKKHQLEL